MLMNDTQEYAVFVYGTLKAGQCREKCWPARPLSTAKAWVLGELYDTGPYPALFSGNDYVAGEVWTFDGDVFDEVLRTLDAIEEYRPGHEAVNLYNRVQIECTDQAGRSYRAHTYIYGRTLEKGAFRRVLPSYVFTGRAFAVWPVEAGW